MKFHCDSCGDRSFIVTIDSSPTCDLCGGSGVALAGLKVPLTDEQKEQNLAALTEYTKPAHIPDGAPWPDVLRALQICASLWEGKARLVGNLRADDIERACREALVALEASR